MLLSWSVSLHSAELPDNFSELSDDVQAVILEYTFFAEQADQVWGDEFQQSSIHSMVKYLDDFHTRVRSILLPAASGSKPGARKHLCNRCRKPLKPPY